MLFFGIFRHLSMRRVKEYVKQLYAKKTTLKVEDCLKTSDFLGFSSSNHLQKSREGKTKIRTWT